MKSPLSTLFKISALIALASGLAAQSKFVYTDDDVSSTNTVSGFSVDANGALTPVSGSPFTTGGSGTGGGAFAVNRITIAGGKFLYASNGGTHDIGAFSIDPNTGILTAVTGSPFSAGATAGFGDISLAASPGGQFLFAGLASNNTVAIFNIGADGSLSPAGSAAVPAQPAGMKVSPNGQYLAVGLPAYVNAGGVAMFSIGANGALTMVNGMPSMDSGAGFLAGVDINCGSTFLTGGEMTPGSTIVDVFSIGSAGALSRIQGSPFSPGVGTNSNVALLSPDDQVLFASNQISKTITSFTVSSSGSLTLVAGSPFAIGATGSNPSGMATDQSGSLLYVASDSPNMIQVFNIAANGALSPVPNSPFAANPSGSLLSLAAFPAKTCAAGSPPPPPLPPPPPPPPPPDPTVQIDIRPGDNNNEINLKSHGKVVVAILSSSTFNAPAADMTSLTFGHTGDENSLAFCDTNRQDANHDGLPDLVCTFYTDKTNFQKGDSMGILKGKLNGAVFQGTDSVHIVP
jgi:6-phosphogluconolactonase (cycloisomerase 2 family)